MNALLFLAAGYAWYAIARLNEQLAATIMLQGDIETANDFARRAQLDFKKQVQEWKDVLIRGADRDLYDKHLKAFTERSARVTQDLASLNSQVPTIGLAPTFADKAIAEHDELDRRYLEALNSYRAADTSSPLEVDKLVRGIDRAPTDHIDELVKTVNNQGEALGAQTAR